MPIVIDKKLCKKCRICIEMCPKKLIELDDEGYVHLKYPEQCNDCALCSWICPDFAVDMIEK